MENVLGSSSYTGCMYGFYVSYQSDAYAGGYIGIGTGTTPVARTDYKLQTQVGSWTADNTPTISGDSIIVAAGITLTSGATVSEAGLALEGVENGGSYSYNFMFLIFHDTFTGFAVSADQTVQVQYTLNLPSGTNNNFIGYLASSLENVGAYSNSPTSYILGTWTNEAGTTLSDSSTLFWGYFYSSCGFIMCTDVASYIDNAQIQVGTSNTAVTPSDYKLNAQVGSEVQTVTWTEDTTTNYRDIYSNTITLSSTTTIQEIGFFLVGYESGSPPSTSDAFLMFHNVITPVSIPGGNAITTQISVGF